jgi:hypothetical protein
MDFTATSGGDGGSYEKPKPGRYTGVLVGVAVIGTHEGGQYGPKAKIMLRWELHKRKGPVVDTEGNPMTIDQRYNQSFADRSTLRPVVEAHMGPIADGQTVRSQDWLGKSAILNLVENGKYINVETVAALDPEEDEAPKPALKLEHWEPADDTPCPSWAKFWWEKSTDFAGKKGSEARNGRAPAMATAGGGGEDDDDIPF